MSFIRLAQVAALAVLLIVGAGSVSVESADCNDESFICASGSPWYRASEVKIRLSSTLGSPVSLADTAVHKKNLSTAVILR